MKYNYAIYTQALQCQGQTLSQHGDALLLKFLQVKPIISAVENDTASNNPSPLKKKEIDFVPLSFI